MFFTTMPTINQKTLQFVIYQVHQTHHFSTCQAWEILIFSSSFIKTAQSWHISLHALCTIKAIWLGTSAEVLEFAALRVYDVLISSGLEKGLLISWQMAELAFFKNVFFFPNIFPEPIYFSLSSATK